MIQDGDPHGQQRLAQRVGQGNVRLAGLGKARRVIMGQNQRGGLEFQRPLDDLPRIDRRLAERSPEHLVMPDQPVLAIDEQHDEHFLVPADQQQREEIPDRLRPVQYAAALDSLQRGPSGQLDGGNERAGLGATQPGHGRQRLERAGQRAGERAVTLQQSLRQRHGPGAGGAAADDEGEQLGIGQRSGAAARQLLPGPVRISHDCQADTALRRAGRLYNRDRFGRCADGSTEASVTGVSFADPFHARSIFADPIDIDPIDIDPIAASIRIAGAAFAWRVALPAGAGRIGPAPDPCRQTGVPAINSPDRLDPDQLIAQGMGAGAAHRVRDDSHLTLHYRLTLLPDEVHLVDTFNGKPATLQLGIGQLAEPLERLLPGLVEGERRVFELPPGEAFGQRQEALVIRVSRAALVGSGSEADEPRGEPALGDPLEVLSADGKRVVGTVRAVDEREVTLDFNHPLAGQAIRFTVHLIGIL